jgi:serine/threonine protein kinase
VTKLVGTPAFVAPEMILAAQSGGFSAYRNFEEASKGDVYAFGILMAALVSEEGKELYDDVKFFNDDFLKEVSCGKRRPVLPKDCPKLIRKWAPKCWHQDPAQRPDFVTLACAFDGREENEYGAPSRRRSASMTDNTPPRRLRFSLRRPRHALSLSTIPRVRMDSNSSVGGGGNTPTVDRIV